MNLKQISNLTWNVLENSKGLLTIQPEESDPNGPYNMFNAGSTEIEVAEFLYGFVRMTKPKHILETGTHAGVSSLYMAMAQECNGFGWTVTLEYERTWVDRARQLHSTVMGNNNVYSPIILNMSSLEHVSDVDVDVLFLDTEPNIRYKELVRFFPRVKPGGFIFIHDLHPNMSYSKGSINPDHPELGEFWPYGSFIEYLGEYLTESKLLPVPFKTPRGFTMFYKTSQLDNANNFATGRPLV